MKKRLIVAIMFCMVMFAGCSMAADKDADDVTREVYTDSSSEEPLQDVPETENNPYSADAQEIAKIVEEFCAAYFGGDLDSVKSFLTDPYIWDIDVYGNSSNEVEILAVKGLEDIGEKTVNDVCVVSVEYREKGMDTCVYLTVEFIKTDKGWEIEFYGNEG